MGGNELVGISGFNEKKVQHRIKKMQTF